MATEFYSVIREEKKEIIASRNHAVLYSMWGICHDIKMEDTCFCSSEEISIHFDTVMFFRLKTKKFSNVCENSCNFC
jgi:hypothetical protein